MKNIIACLLIAGALCIFVSGCKKQEVVTPNDHPEAAAAKDHHEAAVAKDHHEDAAAKEHPEASASEDKPAATEVPKDHPAH